MIVDIFIKAFENDLAYVKQHMTHLEMTDEKGKSLLHYAVMGNAVDVFDYLLSSDISVNLVDRHGESPLFECARKAKLQFAKRLILKFARVNIENRAKELPLHLACFKGDLDMIKLLIESGSFTNKKTNDDRLPIHYAIAGGHPRILNYLLDVSQQSWDFVDSSGHTLLHYAAKTSNLETTKLLLSHRLDPNALNHQFETPLFLAVRFGMKEIVKCLLENEALIDIKNRRFETPLDLALIYDQKEILEVLNEHLGTPYYQRLKEGQAILLTVLNRDHFTCRKLIEAHTPMKKNRLGKTALDYAKAYQLPQHIALLNDWIATE
jgi:uncharacterized protein